MEFRETRVFKLIVSKLKNEITIVFFRLFFYARFPTAGFGTVSALRFVPIPEQVAKASVCTSTLSDHVRDSYDFRNFVNNWGARWRAHVRSIAPSP